MPSTSPFASPLDLLTDRVCAAVSSASDFPSPLDDHKIVSDEHDIRAAPARIGT